MSVLTRELPPTTARTTFRRDAEEVVGRQVGPNGQVRQLTGLRLVLVRDPSADRGFRLLTAFPTHVEPDEPPAPAYPALDLLFGAYLNQEWPEHYRDWPAAVAHWAAESPGCPPLALAELNTLLTCPDAEIAAALTRCDCAYDTGGHPDGVRGWLQELAALLRTMF